MIRTNIELLQYIEKLRKENDNNSFILEDFSPKHKLIVQNKATYYVYIVKSGIAKCYLTQDTGSDFIQEFFGEGELFGEIETISEGSSFCSVESISRLFVYKIHKSHFLELLKEDNKFNSIILKTMANKIRYKAIRHSHNQSNSIKSNITRLYSLFPYFISDISKQDISNYLGINIRSLNRILREINH
ncbi:MAG: Crp/Fnr family transcriptional regulator [Flavobacteriaceae bacterium]|nr:Crp/Fnr family transcriptional regulator [Flavobacteriaceae bacterium]